MNLRSALVVLLTTSTLLGQNPTPQPSSPAAAAISSESAKSLKLLREKALESNFAWKRLAYMCDTFGPRLSGSTNLEAAIDWILSELKKDGMDRVSGDPVEVPVWKRGPESLELVLPRHESLPMLSLGGSVATPPQGLESTLVVVSKMSDLSDNKLNVKGKIVLFNTPFTSYGDTVAVRVNGAIAAAKAGAIASLVRSITPFSLRTPHTGMMVYDEKTPKIPHAALAPEDADRLAREQERGIPIKVRLKISAQNLAPSTSRNVVADLLGSEFPEQIVIVSGHIDSWDIGQGAQDDGGGCISGWEVLRLAKSLGLRPKRTLRLVLWTNEENGTAGAKAYPVQHASELANHVLAFEADEGIFKPEGFRFTGSSQGMEMLKQLIKLALPEGPATLQAGSHSADIGYLLPHGVPTMDMQVEPNRYFWYHHSAGDTVDKVDPAQLRQCIAAIAVMAFGVADHTSRLPR